MRRGPWKFPVLFCIAIIATTGLARGDDILLKSGGKVTGIITARGGGSLTVDIGFGSTVIDSSEIASIKTSSASDRAQLQELWKVRYSDNDRKVPANVKPFIAGMRNLRALRSLAVSRRNTLTRIKREIDSLEKEMGKHTGEYASLNADLNNLTGKEVTEQIRIVGKAHQYNTSLIQCRQFYEEKMADYRNGNPALLEYIDSLSRITSIFDVFAKTNRKADAASEINSITSDLTLLNGEFTTAVIDVTFTNGNDILVPVLINGAIKVVLIVDTGASHVVLSQKCAARLGIDWQKGAPVEAILANGEKVTGRQVRLKSVALQNFRADNVSAIILKNPPAPGVDGLLGMSYLRNFLVNIDGMNKKLVLKEFK